jgi:prephenate dehydrogenase
MMDQVRIVAVVGVGLLGGSIGLGLKKRGFRGIVRGVGHRKISLDTALDMKAIDDAYLAAKEAVVGADLVVICTPAALVIPKLDEIRAACEPHTVVTDVASTKGDICAYAAKTWPHPRRFVGSHPMAGSEKYGPEHATPDLYEGSYTIIERCDLLAPEAREMVTTLWQTLGSRVVEHEPLHHDACVARTSHLPHVAASAVAQLLSACGDDIRPFIGKGFRDTTRVAGGRPEIWRDICATNQKALLTATDELLERLETFRDQLSAGDWEALEAFFQAGHAAHHKALNP